MKIKLILCTLVVAFVSGCGGGSSNAKDPNVLDQPTFDTELVNIQRADKLITDKGCTRSDFIQSSGQEVKCPDTKPEETIAALNSYAHMLQQFIYRYQRAILPDGHHMDANQMGKFQRRLNAVRAEQQRLKDIVDKKSKSGSKDPEAATPSSKL